MISLNDFKAIDLKVATIVEAECVEGSDKLVKLQIDLGQERRQILAGIGKHYGPEELVGRQIVIVANLEPRSLMGLESQGMLLAADDGGPVLLRPDRDVPPGSEVR
ncbi:MAG: methionine--tRNA ligase subunit beta [Candidatus Wildermuthbacteria bacterium]|nr:methionine--tRNA ligase subunit beta [Candidatus Wildermuthbacteria bacterium]